MIQSTNLVKKFDDFVALDNVSCSIPKGCIYGMVGSNGAGKSTFLRVLSGIYRSDGGSITIDGQQIYENPAIKSKICFVPDDLYFLPNANLKRMASLYSSVYKNFDNAKFYELVRNFGLPMNYSINTFSKGMKRQATTILALCSGAEYLLFDETFDGLDPVMRNFVKSLICDDIIQRQATAIVTSHSLRELEDTCDQLVLLHKGGVVLESEVQNLKSTVYKIQVAFNFDYDKTLFEGLRITNYTKSGSVATIIADGNREEIEALIQSKKPILMDILPLTLEEVFTYQMQNLGYNFSDILEGIINE